MLADDPLPGDYTAAERSEWFAKLADWVQAGGNLVLTDGALAALRELTPIQDEPVNPTTVYVGQVSFLSNQENVLDANPLTKDVAQQGARFNSGNRRQTFEPTPLGFAIQDARAPTLSFARPVGGPADRRQGAGGQRRHARGPRPSRTAGRRIGELKVGAGQIRIIGALLPQPATWPQVLQANGTFATRSPSRPRS